MGFDVVYLIGVTRCEDDNVILQIVKIEALVGAQAIATVELCISSCNGRVWDHFVKVVFGVVFVNRHLFFC